MFAIREDLREFREDEEFKLFFNRGGVIFDFCPVDGIFNYKEVDDCLFHQKVTEEKDVVRIISLPIDMRGKNYITEHEILKSDIYHLANRYNEGGGNSYLITKLEFNDETVSLLTDSDQTLIRKIPVSTYEEVEKYIKDNKLDDGVEKYIEDNRLEEVNDV